MFIGLFILASCIKYSVIQGFEYNWVGRPNGDGLLAFKKIVEAITKLATGRPSLLKYNLLFKFEYV